MRSLNYEGPLALSCDDTQLLPALRPYCDAESGCYFVVGHVGTQQPYEIANPDKFQKVLEEGQLVKASKASLNCHTSMYDSDRCPASSMVPSNSHP